MCVCDCVYLLNENKNKHEVIPSPYLPTYLTYLEHQKYNVLVQYSASNEYALSLSFPFLPLSLSLSVPPSLPPPHLERPTHSSYLELKLT